MSDRARLNVRRLGRRDYVETWRAMQRFTDERDGRTIDELWLVEHPPVYTQGLAGRPEHVLSPGEIPIVQTDRGGQVTYHGPGQLVAYPLLDIERLGVGIRTLVGLLEGVVIDLLDEHRLVGERKCGAPGVFVGGAKIASIGMKVRRGCTFHGIAINLDLDLEPFSRINPCGFAGQQMTRLIDQRPDADVARVPERFTTLLAEALGLDWRYPETDDAEQAPGIRPGGRS